MPPYVPAPVPEIIANVDDATIPIERDSDLSDAEEAAKHQRGQAPRRATTARFGREGGREGYPVRNAASASSASHASTDASRRSAAPADEPYTCGA